MRLLFLLCWLVTVPAVAQSFDLEQFDQLFRPRLKVDARWTPPSNFTDHPGSYEDRTAVAVLTIPVWKKWTAGVELNLTGDNLKELLKNSVRVRAAQVMANGRFSTREVRIGNDVRLLHSASLGALGISLTKKYRLLFWSVNVNVSEEERTIDQAVPRFNGIIGKMHIMGVRRQFFYGAAVTVSDGLNVPLPFVGGSEPMGKRWTFQYVLPLQLAIGFKASSRTRLLSGIGVDGYRSGFEGMNASTASAHRRQNINYTALRAFLIVRHRLSKAVQLRAEVAALPAHSIRLPGAHDDLDRYAIDPGVSLMIGMNVFFGESTLEQLLNAVLK